MSLVRKAFHQLQSFLLWMDPHLGWHLLLLLPVDCSSQQQQLQLGGGGGGVRTVRDSWGSVKTIDQSPSGMDRPVITPSSFATPSLSIFLSSGLDAPRLPCRIGHHPTKLFFLSQKKL